MTNINLKTYISRKTTLSVTIFMQLPTVVIWRQSYDEVSRNTTYWVKLKFLICVLLKIFYFKPGDMYCWWKLDIILLSIKDAFKLLWHNLPLSPVLLEISLFAANHIKENYILLILQYDYFAHNKANCTNFISKCNSVIFFST